MFYRECQTHSYGDSVEKMCFCSFMLCNAAPEAKAAHSTAKCSGLLAICVLIVAAAWDELNGGDVNIFKRRRTKVGWKNSSSKNFEKCFSSSSTTILSRPNLRKREEILVSFVVVHLVLNRIERDRSDKNPHLLNPHR